jgi:hypothetical protein
VSWKEGELPARRRNRYDLAVRDVECQAVAIPLDLIGPVFALGHLVNQGREAGLNPLRDGIVEKVGLAGIFWARCSTPDNIGLGALRPGARGVGIIGMWQQWRL